MQKWVFFFAKQGLNLKRSIKAKISHCWVKVRANLVKDKEVKKKKEERKKKKEIKVWMFGYLYGLHVWILVGFCMELSWFLVWN